jgi:acetyltransferase-like isoleucine patch superfamily enzyme
MANHFFKKLKQYFIYLPYIVPIVWFNFKYLPARQAVRLPIFLYRPKFRHSGGKVIIDSEHIRPGMIRMGHLTIGIYRNDGIIWDVTGTVVFRGKCIIGGGSAINLVPTGCLVFGHRFIANANTKIICHNKIEFGYSVNLGWDVTVIDTDFHALKNAVTHKKMNPTAPVVLGDYTWIGHHCLIVKGTKTPQRLIASEGSKLSGRYRCGANTIVSGNPAQVIMEDSYYRDFEDDWFELTPNEYVTQSRQT